jgi:hypothetical protein
MQRIRKPGIVQSHVKGFDRIRDHAGVEQPERIELFVRQQGSHDHTR